MPSADESNSSPSYLIKVMPEATSYHRQTAQSATQFNSRDVDCLVTRLKKNLRLSNQQQLKSRPSMQQRLRRPTPYRLPTSRCPSEPPSFSRYRQRALEVRHVDDELDSFEQFQNLLRQGSLIKEAVKRLRSSNDELSTTGMGLDDDDDDREDVVGVDGKCFLGASICNSTTTIGSSSPNSSDNDDEDCCQDDVTGLMCLM